MPELLLSCQGLARPSGTAPLFEDLSFGIFEGDHIGLDRTERLRQVDPAARSWPGSSAPSAGTRSARKRLRIGYVEPGPDLRRPTRPWRSVLLAPLAGRAARPRRSDGAHRGDAWARPGSPTGSSHRGCAVGRLARSAWPSPRELVREPELLLLDEPTNHLDVDGILWLEDLLRREPEAFVAVSHDRYFLEAAAGRVIELNRAFAAGLLDVRGRYSVYLAKKDELLAGQASYQESLRNRVRGELDWLVAQGQGAHAQGAGAHRRGAAGCRDELADLDARSRRRRRSGSSSRAPSAGRSDCWWPQGLSQVASARAPSSRGLDLVLVARHAAGPAGRERQRQDHAAAPARRPGGAGRRARSSARPTCAS